ncbi:putative beta-glucan synthesis-associated protein [Smittium culicis]|uniref:Putative beta-glucan synthesis-associated protein n=3 Tax=Smittium culicis TaxID=133412 RepID=A0A1R1YBT8_9FUNG|nr:putative beta-glucan synthesis-associated protein [Smittium culicis]
MSSRSASLGSTGSGAYLIKGFDVAGKNTGRRNVAESKVSNGTAGSDGRKKDESDTSEMSRVELNDIDFESRLDPSFDTRFGIYFDEKSGIKTSISSTNISLVEDDKLGNGENPGLSKAGSEKEVLYKSDHFVVMVNSNDKLKSISPIVFKNKRRNRDIRTMTRTSKPQLDSAPANDDGEDGAEETMKMNIFKLNKNVYAILLLILILFFVLLALPLMQLRNKKKDAVDIIRDTKEKVPSPEEQVLIDYAKRTTLLGQKLIPDTLPIDPDTPMNKRSFTTVKKEVFQLVFSDEFNKDGRTFEPGKDKFWEAQDFHYWATNDLEYYHPKQATTKGGNLELKLENKVTVEGLNYTSGMVNSWNKFCFQGGYLEVRASFPGDGKIPGYWPAAWTLGNLGRAGFGATTDGLWPYTYNTCDSGVLINQTNPYLSRLPGQRLNACVCTSEGGNHPSPGIGRGAPEIDIFEGSVIWNGPQTLSMSFQVAPFDHQHDTIASAMEYRNLPGGNARGVGVTSPNTYRGGFLQQSVSAVHHVDNSVSGGRKFETYGFEYVPGPRGYIQWYANGIPVFKIDSRAIGPNKLSKIGQRVISEEPMYIIMNLGFSNSFGSIDFENIKFPASLLIDYVRLYQHPDRIKLSCDPEDRPTSQYIMDHALAYYNPNITFWDQTGYGIPEYDINSQCSK